MRFWHVGRTGNAGTIPPGSVVRLPGRPHYGWVGVWRSWWGLDSVLSGKRRRPRRPHLEMVSVWVTGGGLEARLWDDAYEQVGFLLKPLSVPGMAQQLRRVLLVGTVACRMGKVL